MALPVYLNELQSLPEKLQLNRLRLYQGSINPVSDGVLLMWRLLGGLHSERLIRLFTKLFIWSNRYFTQPPFGVVQRVLAQGMKEGRPDSSRPHWHMNRHTWRQRFLSWPPPARYWMEQSPIPARSLWALPSIRNGSSLR